MSWSVTGLVDDQKRHATWVDGHVDGDPATTLEISALLDEGVGVPETPTGPVYATHGQGDERGAYLLALYLLAHATVTGDPPPKPGLPTSSDVEQDTQEIAY